MHRGTVDRLSRLVTRQAADFGGDYDSGIPQVTQFRSIDDVERIANDLELSAGADMTATRVEMAGVFYELALNAVEHSQWAVGYYVIRVGSGSIIDSVEHTVGIADCGIGIPDSLRRNPEFADVLNDADAITLATELHVTGTGESHRGVGLDHVMNVVKSFGGSLTIISAGGSLAIVDGAAICKGSLEGIDRLAGTVVVATISVPV